MTRKVDLVSYLPPFLAAYKETAETLAAENPEFVLVWNATDKVLKNMYIETADEYGISRFEKILNILPTPDDTIESRRSRVQARWFNMIPYTLKAFIAKLEAVCGDSDFTIIKDYLHYTIQIETNLELFGQVEELERMIAEMIPCNMITVSNNRIPCDAAAIANWAGGVVSVEHFFITNDEQYSKTIQGVLNFGGGIVENQNLMITNDSNEHFTITNTALFGAGVVNTATVMITNDFNEQFNIDTEHKAGSGAVFTEFIGIHD